MNKLLSHEERERRLRVIEEGVTSNFWKVTKESLAYQMQEKMIECVDLLYQNKIDEAKTIAIEYKTMEKIINEPQTIIRHNKPLFDKFIISFCEGCGNLLKKLKPKEVKQNA